MTSEIAAIRRRCQTDLYFLLKEVLIPSRGLNPELITEFTHRAIADFFVQKNPDKSIAEQDEVKKRLLLYPRNSYKSTFDIADAIQWIICFPDIRILILCGASDLADGFVRELQDYFTIPDRGEPTLFQSLFPEFCVDKKDLRSGDFTVPCRTKTWKEPTVMANSIESNLSGWHFDVVKCDDVVTNKNSETETGIAKINKNMHINRKMLEPWGYWDMIGTRYNPTDAYGEALALVENNDMKVLLRPAWWLKEGILKNSMDTWLEDEVILLFPEKLTYKFLRHELRQDSKSFYSQYMNDPLKANDAVFTMEMMRAATIPHTQLPRTGTIRVIWDFAVKSGIIHDHSAGAVAIHSEGRIYILDVVYDKFSHSDLAATVVSTSMHHGSHECSIEDSMGARFLESEIMRAAQKLQWDFSIDWIPLDNSKGAKESRVSGLEALITDGRLWFSSSIRCMEELYRQFTRFGMTKRDDICDAIAHQQRFLKRAEELPGDQDANLAQVTARENYDRIYGLGKFLPQPAPPRPDPNALPDILGGLNG